MTVFKSTKTSTGWPKPWLVAVLACGSLISPAIVANGQSRDRIDPATSAPDHNVFLHRLLERPATAAKQIAPISRPLISPAVNQSAQNGYRVAFSSGNAYRQDDVEQEYLPDFPRLESEASRSDAGAKADDFTDDSEAKSLLADETDAPDRDDLDSDENGDRDTTSRTFGTWPQKSIREVRIDPRDFGDRVPSDSSASLFTNATATMPSTNATNKLFAWAAPDIRYQPLYFEDVSLERYGQTKGLVKQPFVSAGKFLADATLLPLRAYRDNPQTCDTPLGFCRPGASSNRCPCEQCQPGASVECTECTSCRQATTR